MAEKVVLAYCGGLDTSVLIRWIKEKYGYDIITLTSANVRKREHFNKPMQYKVAAKAATQARKAK
jgi:argininosuccinate synthase